ncbi:MAG: hypothetical protein ACRD9R_07880, partial [Pyrinomonadaceae bacterium]
MRRRMMQFILILSRPARAVPVVFALCAMSFLPVLGQPAARPFAPTIQAAQSATPPPAPKRNSRRLKGVTSKSTPRGTNVTITGEGGALKDYMSYRSGDRFFVVVPRAEADALGGDLSGRGFEDAKVERRGQDAVLSFKLRPGASARVASRGDRLEVQFNADGLTSGENNTGVAPVAVNPATARQDRLDMPPVPVKRSAPRPDTGAQASADAPAALPAVNPTTVAPAEPLPEVAGAESSSSQVTSGGQVAPPPQATPIAVPTLQPETAPRSRSLRLMFARFWPLVAATLLLTCVGLLVLLRRKRQPQSTPVRPAAAHAHESVNANEAAATLMPARIDDAATVNSATRPVTSEERSYATRRSAAEAIEPTGPTETIFETNVPAQMPPPAQFPPAFVEAPPSGKACTDELELAPSALPSVGVPATPPAMLPLGGAPVVEDQAEVRPSSAPDDLWIDLVALTSEPEVAPPFLPESKTGTA